jgi:hypothetical protein
MDPTYSLFYRILINIVAVSILVWAIYFKRYRNKQMAVSMIMMNIAIFSVMGIITNESFGVQAGLGLFAILSIFRFRSKNFEQMDITYFFSTVAIAIITAAAPVEGIGAPVFVADAVVLLAAFFFDYEGTLGRLHTTEVCLDHIPEYLFDEKRAVRELSSMFGVSISRFTVAEVDYVKDTATVEISFIANRPGARIPKTGITAQGVGVHAK